MFPELKPIEKWVHCLIGKPIAWTLLGCWLIIVHVAIASVWLRNWLVHGKAE